MRIANVCGKGGERAISFQLEAAVGRDALNEVA
ncbi:hypothetical protein X946_4707 [Burkholderia sp. ABCPW 111]|nr:hypothetical protein X946_4707 [Burkholderia sp. ABCPW 111]